MERKHNTLHSYSNFSHIILLLRFIISSKYNNVKNEVLTDFDVNKLLMKTYDLLYIHPEKPFRMYFPKKCFY